MVRKKRQPLREYLVYLLNTTTQRETIAVVLAKSLDLAIKECDATICRRGYKVLRGKQI